MTTWADKERAAVEAAAFAWYHAGGGTAESWAAEGWRTQAEFKRRARLALTAAEPFLLAEFRKTAEYVGLAQGVLDRTTGAALDAAQEAHAEVDRLRAERALLEAVVSAARPFEGCDVRDWPDGWAWGSDRQIKVGWLRSLQSALAALDAHRSQGAP